MSLLAVFRAYAFALLYLRVFLCARVFLCHFLFLPGICQAIYTIRITFPLLVIA